jgi:tRNA pseudouridine38-40 synthase
MKPRRYRAVVAYDGARYQGFQRLGGGEPTIQAALESALSQVGGGKAVQVIGAGRTDAGVHATGQVVAFDLAWKHDTDRLLNALNATLPIDIAVQRIQETHATFHPRYDAVSRAYRYFVFEAQVRQPLMAGMSWWVKPPAHTRLDVEAMDWAAAKLLGTHDFASFGSPPQGDNTKRHVYDSAWEVEVPTAGTRLLSYRIEANAFLYHMVRTVVGALVEVGLHRLSMEAFIAAFASAQRGSFTKLAPPHGLTLTDVNYDEAGQAVALDAEPSAPREHPYPDDSDDFEAFGSIARER